MRFQYRYSLQGAYEAGERRHPQVVILEIADNPADFEPAPIGDCWLFTSEMIMPLPSYIDPVEVHDGLCARSDHRARICKCYSECLWCGRKLPDAELQQTGFSRHPKMPVKYECKDTEVCNKYIKTRIIVGPGR